MSFLELITGVKQTREAIIQRLSELSTEQNDIRSRLQEIDGGKIAKSELRAAVNAWVDRQGAAFVASARGGLMKILDEPASSLTKAPGFVNHRMAMLFRGVGATDERLGGATGLPDGSLVAFLCAAFRDDVCATLNAAIDAMDYDEGLPATDRPAARAKLSQRLDALNAEVTSLRAKAAEAGLKL